VRFLLDTNAFIWALEDNPRLGRKARSLITDTSNDVIFSVVSVWEVLIKARVGKTHLNWRKLTGAAAEAGFERIGVEMAHLAALADLPYHHRDPFDHLILATATAEKATLITSDGDMLRYGVPIVECG
jgi:PIN domain nuclease of toxin-antitoxin system